MSDWEAAVRALIECAAGIAQPGSELARRVKAARRALARTEGDTPFAAAPACDRTHWEQVIEDAKAGLCACGHEPDEHVHYCPHELDSGSCPCEVEYVARRVEALPEHAATTAPGYLVEKAAVLAILEAPR